MWGERFKMVIGRSKKELLAAAYKSRLNYKRRIKMHAKNLGISLQKASEWFPKYRR